MEVALKSKRNICVNRCSLAVSERQLGQASVVNKMQSQQCHGLNLLRRSGNLDVILGELK